MTDSEYITDNYKSANKYWSNDKRLKNVKTCS